LQTRGAPGKWTGQRARVRFEIISRDGNYAYVPPRPLTRIISLRGTVSSVARRNLNGSRVFNKKPGRGILSCCYVAAVPHETWLLSSSNTYGDYGLLLQPIISPVCSTFALRKFDPLRASDTSWAVQKPIHPSPFFSPFSFYNVITKRKRQRFGCRDVQVPSQLQQHL